MIFPFTEKKHHDDPDDDSGMGSSILTDTKSSIFTDAKSITFPEVSYVSPNTCMVHGIWPLLLSLPSSILGLSRQRTGGFGV